MKLINKAEPNTINVRDMQDGQIAIIREWWAHNQSYKGRIVQRWGNDLITLGGTHGESWLSLFSDYYRHLHHDSKVEILPPGTTLEI